MSIKMLTSNTWLVQVQRAGRRKTRRGTGGESEAKRVESQLAAELDQEVKLDAAADLLGLDRRAPEVAKPLTLRQFFERRWIAHAQVVQNKTTRMKSAFPFKYLIYYLGDRRLEDLLEPAAINNFVEKMKQNGSISFVTRKDGQPWKGRGQELSNATINKCLQRLRALLHLAHAEKVICTKPRVDLLPEDDSEAVVAPTDEQYQKLLDACADYIDVAPLMREVCEFTAETGLRCGEVFALAFRSVDLQRNCIRVETQRRVRMVNGKAWKPKNCKWREIPLSVRARQIIDARVKVDHEPHDQVFPNQGGAPYHRMDQADGVSGKGFFWDIVKSAGLRGVITFHGLRHLFAVRLLTRGVPITVVSELLGHSDINLTVKRYGRFASDAKVKWDAVKVLD